MAERSASGIFKAYDVRGVVPDDLDSDIARRIGSAFARWSKSPAIAIGRDCRMSSPQLAEALGQGMTEAGADVVDIGLASTDLLYFASGHLDLPGVMLTASHNPPQWNGMKFCRAGAAPVGQDTGLGEIAEMVDGPQAPPADKTGELQKRDLLGPYVEHVLSFIDAAALRPLKVVADTANGMGGLVLPAVAARLPIELIHLYPELDGTFPNHPADPIDPANQEDLKAAVLEHGADIGLAFDGDADRVFVVDELAQGVSGSEITALVAKAMLTKNPGATVVHNVITSWTVPEVIAESGGRAVRTRVGHSFIKQVMAETDAIFGGEHSGHYYFRDNYRADSGLIAAVIVLEQLSLAGGELSEALRPFRRYSASGEINSRVADTTAATARVAEAYPDGDQDRLDGLTIAYPDWWCNVRPSNTEPLLRLNVEARTQDLLDEKTSALLALIRTGGEADA